MDSLTQATLGAAVAHACWHRPLGRKAIPWGLALGTLPDLDVLASPWLDPVENLYWHRGISHSLWLMALGGLLTGLLVRWLHRRAGLTVRQAATGGMLIWVTHVAIDLFTVYGTQLLAPFSRHGFATNNLFIIDPAFTVPLLLGLLGALLWRTPATRFRLNLAGLALASLYVVWSFAAQARAAAVFERELARQNLQPTAAGLTMATPLNTVLWRHLTRVEGGFLIGYWSLADADERVTFDFVPQLADTPALAPVRDSRAFAAVDWFSQGWWAVVDPASGRVADLRFGETRPTRNAPAAAWWFPFSWRFPPDATGAPQLSQVPLAFADRGAALGDLWDRIRGQRPSPESPAQPTS